MPQAPSMTLPTALTMLAALCLGAVFAGPGPAHAQTAGQIALELNNLEPAEGGCRLTLVGRNDAGQTISQATYDVAVFDADGVVRDRLLLEFGALPQGRMRVVQFFLARGCDQIGRVHLNDAEACLSETGGSLALCMDALETTSRIDGVQLGL